MRKSGLNMWVCSEQSKGMSGHRAIHYEGTLVPSGKVSDLGSVTAREAHEWSDCEVSLTLTVKYLI